MSSKEAISTDKAPKPIPGVYNQAIVAGGTVYCSGQVAMDPATGKIIDGDIQAHTVGVQSVDKKSTYDWQRLRCRSTAPVSQEPDRRAGGRRFQYGQSSQSRRVLVKHGRFCTDERSVQDLFRRC